MVISLITSCLCAFSVQCLCRGRRVSPLRNAVMRRICQVNWSIVGIERQRKTPWRSRTLFAALFLHLNTSLFCLCYTCTRSSGLQPKSPKFPELIRWFYLVTELNLFKTFHKFLRIFGFDFLLENLAHHFVFLWWRRKAFIEYNYVWE